MFIGTGALIASKGRASRLFAGTSFTSRTASKIPVLGRLFARRGIIGVEGVSSSARAISQAENSALIWEALVLEGKAGKAAIDALGVTNVALKSNIDKMVAALHGLSGATRAKQVARLRSPFVGPYAPGFSPPAAAITSAVRVEAEALLRWQSVSRWMYYPRFGFSQFKTWAGFKSNAWALGKVTLGNMAIKPFTNALGVGIPAVVGAGVADAVLPYDLIKEHIRGIKNRTKRINARLKMTPADDNIFAPSPASYMTLRKIVEMGFMKKMGHTMNDIVANTLGINVVSTWETVMRLWDPQAIDPELFEKRVLPTACQYILHASTIWEVFEEMTLRHPGWIWGTRPYGTEFRDTMFFGTPSQRYWSRPASSAFVLRMNKLYEYIQRTGETEEIIKKQIIEVYGTDIADKMFEEEVEVRQVGGQTVGSAPSQRSASTTVTINNGIDLELIKDKFRVAIMDEWLKGMEQRFEPFRRYHLVTSERDIISNNIICSEHSVVNAAQVVHSTMNNLGQIKEQEKSVLQMKAHSLIPDHMLNTAVVDKHNCKSYKMALRYGQAAMMYGLKEMYKGEISLLGNPRIRPWDVCILADSYNDMSGPIEVESVVHMFSHETGFITEIKPNALVIGNEIATYPILEAMKLYAMAKVDWKITKCYLTEAEATLQ